MSKTLFLSDDFIFYTIEGEGRFIGCPSVFMRLAMCNLTCKGFVSADSPHGCDSFVSWSVKNKRSFDEIFKLLEDGGYVERLRNGAVWKITGGEPLIQQSALLDLAGDFVVKYGFRPIIDFETNGTIMPDNDWILKFGASFTTSPKLSNNGDPEEKRYKPDVLKRLIEFGACFKFVVRDGKDLEEIHTKYVVDGTINLPKRLIWLMPCCGSREEQSQVSSSIAELCKAYGVKFSPRLQLMIWNRALQV